MVSRPRVRPPGFTLIELLVVMSIIAMLLALAAPRYFNSVDKSKEAMLKQTLVITREALDKYYGDNGRYPDDLETLVSRKYLRKLPYDPVTGSSSTWIVVPPDNPEKGAVFDVRSGAEGASRDGAPFRDW
ncbi:MAG: prepilin-type N-terminal cleavage/methylation domain-containing protein [Rhodocyclales bacterium]|nr:prepilin-type N-terminal cleavage/methylation domain-containing protein [Rhodocyclales bacterium]